jgi:hypothetical protein
MPKHEGLEVDSVKIYGLGVSKAPWASFARISPQNIWKELAIHKLELSQGTLKEIEELWWNNSEKLKTARIKARIPRGRETFCVEDIWQKPRWYLRILLATLQFLRKIRCLTFHLDWFHNMGHIGCWNSPVLLRPATDPGFLPSSGVGSFLNNLCCRSICRMELIG